LVWLWIAFKICIFDFQKQQILKDGRQIVVVNCFQNLYLWLSETAYFVKPSITYLLWIAFKICIFDFQKQRDLWWNYIFFSCELLSKFVSLTFRNSAWGFVPLCLGVVNCFQNLYLWLSETAKPFALLLQL